MILQIDYPIERKEGEEFILQIEAEFEPGEDPTFYESPGRQVCSGSDPKIWLGSITLNGADFPITPAELSGIRQALWDKVAERGAE